MTKYFIKRLFLLLITLVIIVTIVFFLLQLMPGYPKAVQTKIDQAKNPEEYAAAIASYQTGSNVLVRYGKYISGIFHGDFGTYYTDKSQKIQSLFLKPMRYTLMITGPAFLIGTVIGIIFGFVAGYKRGKWPDVTLNFIATVLISVPTFIFATFLIAFGRKVGLQVDWNTAKTIGKTTTVVILPIVAVTISSFAMLTYFIRNEVVEVLTSDYISIARAKGVSETGIFFKHVVRNAAIPMVSIILPSFVSIIMGSMVIEVFFGIPGSSHIFTTAIQNRELYVVMFSTIFFTALGLFVLLISDILFALLDPRIKFAESSRRPLKLVIKTFIARSKQKRELRLKSEVQNV